MEIAFIIIATLIFIFAVFYYTVNLVETKEGILYFICGQLVWICTGIGGGHIIMEIAKAIFH